MSKGWSRILAANIKLILVRYLEGVIIGVEFPQLIELTMQIGDGVDLLSGHGAHHREAYTERGDEAFALDQAEGLTAFIEDLFIQDSLELMGHGGKVSGIHSTCLSFIEGVCGLDGS